MRDLGLNFENTVKPKFLFFKENMAEFLLEKCNTMVLNWLPNSSIFIGQGNLSPFSRILIG